MKIKKLNRKKRSPNKSLENLKPRLGLTNEEAKAMGRLGGLKSVQVRREKKSMMELANIILNNQETSKAVEKMQKVYPNMKVEDITNGFIMLAKQVEKARNGELPSLNFLVEMAGQKPTADTAININNNLEPKTINVTFVKPDNIEDKNSDDNT